MISKIGNLAPQKVTFGLNRSEEYNEEKPADRLITRGEVDRLILQAKNDVKNDIAKAGSGLGRDQDIRNTFYDFTRKIVKTIPNPSIED